MANEYKDNKGINALGIRIIAALAMLWSFLCSVKIPGLENSALADCMYWFSYTLFAFLLTEGVKNTSNRIMYIERFAVFTAVSEVAYDYYTYGTYWSTKGQSIMLTLFICLTVMLFCDYLARRFNNIVINLASIFILAVGAINLAAYLNCEFSKYGVLIAMLFFASRNVSYPKLMQIALMGYYTYMVSTDTIITITVNGLQYSVPIAVFAILALFVSWFYNKKRGANPMALKIIFYLIYPLMLFAFYFVNNFIII